MTAEVRAVLAVIADVNQFELMRNELTADDFENILAKELFLVLEECYRGGDMSFPSILNHCQDAAVRQMITEAVASGEYQQNTAQTVHDSIVMIKRSSLSRQRDAILGRIRMLNPGTAEDRQQLQALVEQKMIIDHQLKN